jgi:hypothetical protein
MGVYELLWGGGILILLGAIAWAAARYHSRNRANDEITERATRVQYTDPDGAVDEQARLRRQVRRG